MDDDVPYTPHGDLCAILRAQTGLTSLSLEVKFGLQWVGDSPTFEPKELEYAAWWDLAGVAGTLTRSSRDSLEGLTTGTYAAEDEHGLDWTVLVDLRVLRLKSPPYNAFKL